MLLAFSIIAVFVIGAAVGSFLNVCIARLPLEKSLMWPGSRCGNCFQPIKWYDNLPLVSYLWLRGRCRTCRQGYSIRYFFIELFTGLGFAALFCIEVVANIHQWPASFRAAVEMKWGIYPWEWWAGFGYHAILFSFLVVAAVCDMQYRYIPMRITMVGMLVGLAGSFFFPWPWPHLPTAGFAGIEHQDIAWWRLPTGAGPKDGLYPWPVWGPLPPWLPAGSRLLGLATGIAGVLAGTFLLRAVAFIFGKGLGKEALGLGDADVMMMAGAFLGWQPVVIAFFVSMIPGLLVGLFQVIVRRDGSLPFAPPLAIGVVITMLCWRWMGPPVKILLFWDVFLVTTAIAAAGFMFLSSYMIRIVRPAPKRSDSEKGQERQTVDSGEKPE